MLKKIFWSTFLFSSMASAAPSDDTEFLLIQLPSFQPVMKTCGQVFARPWILPLGKTVKADQANFKAEIAAIIKYGKKCKELVAANRLQQYKAEAQPLKDKWQAASQKYLTAPERGESVEKIYALLDAARAISTGKEHHEGLKDWMAPSKQCVTALGQFNVEGKRAEEAKTRNLYKVCRDIPKN